MAGVFPYRGPGNPVPGPLAPLPDYMSEEKLQEKGEEHARGAEPRLRVCFSPPAGSPPLLCKANLSCHWVARPCCACQREIRVISLAPPQQRPAGIT